MQAKELRDLCKLAIDAYIYFDTEYDGDSEASTAAALNSMEFATLAAPHDALVSELQTAIAWIEERGTPTAKHAPTANEILPQLRAALEKARS